jgi:hypothetical protein
MLEKEESRVKPPGRQSIFFISFFADFAALREKYRIFIRPDGVW